MSEWKLVPSEPTPEMVYAGENTTVSHAWGAGGEFIDTDSARDVYSAILAASPPAPDVCGALEEAIEFADDEVWALTPTGQAMVERWRAVLAQIKGETSPGFNEPEPHMPRYPRSMCPLRDCRCTDQSHWTCDRASLALAGR